MHGQRPQFRPGGGVGRGGRGQPPSQPPPPSLNADPNITLQNPNFYLQNLTSLLLQGLATQQNPYNYFPAHQNPNFRIQNPNFPIPLPQQFPHGFAQQHQHSNSSFAQQHQHSNSSFAQQHQPSNSSFAIQNSTIPPRQQLQNSPCLKPKEKEITEKVERPAEKVQDDLAQPQHQQPPPAQEAQNLTPQDKKQVKQQQPQAQAQHLPRERPKQFKKHGRNELLEQVDRAVEKAWQDFLSAGESVSAWKVSQAALVMLQVDSWGSLGFRMQEVNSLHRLMFIEGKVLTGKRVIFEI